MSDDWSTKSPRKQRFSNLGVNKVINSNRTLIVFNVCDVVTHVVKFSETICSQKEIINLKVIKFR